MSSVTYPSIYFYLELICTSKKLHIITADRRPGSINWLIQSQSARCTVIHSGFPSVSSCWTGPDDVIPSDGQWKGGRHRWPDCLLTSTFSTSFQFVMQKDEQPSSLTFRDSSWVTSQPSESLNCGWSRADKAQVGNSVIIWFIGRVEDFEIIWIELHTIKAEFPSVPEQCLTVLPSQRLSKILQDT